MNQKPKDKPIVELLQDIHTTRDPGSRRGLVNPRKFDRIVSLISIASVSLISFTFLAMIWDGIAVNLGLRCIASMFVLLITLHVFRAMNEQVD